jgi:hypothetical protein
MTQSNPSLGDTFLQIEKFVIKMERDERIAIIKAEQKRRKDGKRKLKAGLEVGFALTFPPGIPSHIASFLCLPISEKANREEEALSKKWFEKKIQLEDDLHHRQTLRHRQAPTIMRI